MTRPLLPRTSSGTSGFFFCGMIELPVQKRSASVTKPKRGLVHSTSSSAKRDRCIIDERRGRRELDREVAIGNGVERVVAIAVEAELARDELAVDRIGGAGERGRAERQPVDAPAAVGEALDVAREHLVVGQQVMAERDRLRDLQVREARHDRVGVALGQVEQRAAQRRAARTTSASIAPRSHRRMSVATWSLRERAGVQALAGVADQRGQALLDVEVHVLEVDATTRSRRARSRRGSPPGRARCRRGPAAQMMPAAASMRACASEPSMSTSARRRSKPTDAV